MDRYFNWDTSIFYSWFSHIQCSPHIHLELTPYFFNSHLIYACQVWGQDSLYLQRLSILQNKALRIINFKEYDYPTNDLYHESKILKIEDYIKLLNCFFVKDVLEKTSIK